MILEVSSRVIEQDGQPIGVQGICRDVTSRRRDEIELRRLSELNRHQALHDDLTGLPNRACFGQQVEHAIRVADQDGSQLAVLLMDLDRFKEINDTLGHRYGDLLLIELARRLQSVLRRSDTVARLGGDEFGILVRQLSAADDALDHALERLLAALEQPFLVDGCRCTSRPASGSPASRHTAATSTRCCSAPTWRCTWPRRRGAARRLRPPSTIGTTRGA